MKSGQNAVGPKEPPAWGQASRNLTEEATLFLGMSRSLSGVNIMLNLEKLLLQCVPQTPSVVRKQVLRG